MSVTTRFTVEEFLARDFPPRTQLIDGEVVLMTDARLRHQRLCLFLVRRLAEWTEAADGRGEAGFGCNWILGSRNLFIPDVWWIGRELPDTLLLDGFPDLAVEVRSPSTWRYDIGPKRDTYERGGVAELWLVDTESDTVIVHRRSTPDAPGFDALLELERGDTLTSPLFEGLEITVEELFDR